MTTPDPRHLLWLDLETTTSDPHDPIAAILEVGAIITVHEPELTEVARASMLIRPPGGQPHHDTIWGQMLPVVQQMHQASGLWAEATTSDAAWGITEADRAITDWLIRTVGDEPVTLCGSGVAHLDHPYVKAHMPLLATRLTYYAIDTGNVRRFLKVSGRRDLVDDVTFTDSKPHRGLDDIALHVEEARRYAAVMAQIPAQAPTPVLAPACGDVTCGASATVPAEHPVWCAAHQPI